MYDAVSQQFQFTPSLIPHDAGQIDREFGLVLHQNAVYMECLARFCQTQFGEQLETGCLNLADGRL